MMDLYRIKGSQKEFLNLVGSMAMFRGSPFYQSADKTIDLRGLNCPLPVLLTAKALRKSAPGTLLRIECTDPLAGIDIPHFISGTTHILEGQTNDGNTIVFFVRRA